MVVVMVVVHPVRIAMYQELKLGQVLRLLLLFL
jgi:hypothetical protein